MWTGRTMCGAADVLRARSLWRARSFMRARSYFHAEPRRRGGLSVARLITRIAGVLLAVMMTSCAHVGGPPADTPATRADAQFAVLQFLVREFQPPDGRVPCLSVRGSGGLEPPDPRLLDRFRALEPGAVPGPECGLESAVGRMVHRSSGARAILYYVSTAEPAGTGRYAVAAGYHAGSLDGSSCGYVARAAAGRWDVRHDGGSCIVS
jgi:hypothetical protein